MRGREGDYRFHSVIIEELDYIVYIIYYNNVIYGLRRWGCSAEVIDLLLPIRHQNKLQNVCVGIYREALS